MTNQGFYKFSQSKKWLEELAPQHRAPMPRDGRVVYQCTLCEGSKITSYRRHALGGQHRARVREHDKERVRIRREQIEEEDEETDSEPDIQENSKNDNDNRDTYNIQQDLDRIELAARFLQSTDSRNVNLNETIRVHDLINAHLAEVLRQQDEEFFGEQPNQNREGNDDGDGGDPAERERWFPFKSRMELVGSLLIGHTHSLISRAIYNKVKAVMSICDIQLPSWATVRSARDRIRKLLPTQLNLHKSAFGTPCFALSVKGILSQDLANPLVSPHIDYYPEMTNQGFYKFSQSKKWLKELAPQHCAPMCEVKGKHFYLFEPVELFSGLITIPIYFYSHNSQIYSKCIAPEFEPFIKKKKKLVRMKIPQNIQFNHFDLLSIPTSDFNKSYDEIQIYGKQISEACANSIYEHDGNHHYKKIKFPNPWRKEADGRIIRHVPITLYCDDTSGNISKKFKKHVSFYFTLSGLPPNLSNQEYNCHFLSTSNRASALEILEQIVAEMNQITRYGFTAFDSHIMQEVLVTGLVFSFLGDSPMHAEITNTPNPGSSLNPCQMCTLHAEGKDQRKTLDYVLQFLRMNPDGSEATGNKRCWKVTHERTYELYTTAIDESHAEFLRKQREWGVTDSLNNRFLKESKKNLRIRELMENLEENHPERLFNSIFQLEGFDGVKDTPVKILHVALLGFVKYLARDVLSGNKLKPHQKAQLVARLQSFNTLSLNIPPINGKSFVTHIKSLVGKEFKILVQAAPFLFF
ncbi:hypothetical protein PTTG_29470 [Puccinia triticina 1-1 BBBD Race 1]|uniref:U1-type domain-containing protein n=1 Tax=Puccinia triticina (isolate 1-1 / race 1 (BBBD)) TaxID=630390 RepID=A0A180G3V9_PUCT1|nr:hypothetical protein PTTG_29470 [Puccinia triticina 1-1 BBBD Race 1]